MPSLERHLNRRYGYTSQPWLAVDIADRYFGSRYRVWFATCLNPASNGDSSNPMLVYRDLTNIVGKNDFNHARVQQLRQRIANWVGGSRLSSVDIASLLPEIASAPVSAFRPALWRIDLALVNVVRLINLGQYPDEYMIRDLTPWEFQTIAWS